MTHRSTTLNEALERAAANGESEGLRLLDRHERASWLSWPEVASRARRVAGALQALGLGRGDRVALIHPTSAGFFDAFFGALLAGAVPVPLYPPVRLGRLDEYHRRTARMIGLAGARLVLADRRVRRILGETVRRARPELGCLAVGELAAGKWRDPGVVADDLALVQFSSGTTVEPKPVALSHRAIVAQATTLNAFWPDDDSLRHSGLSWLPLYHDMGLIGCVVPALERPATLTLLPPEAFVARPALWLRALSRYGATVSPAPNFAYALCLHRIEDAEMDGVELSRWRVALNGAETVVPEVMRAFGERFARWGFDPRAMTPVYGMSEAALAVTFTPPGRGPRTGRFERARLAAGRAVACGDDGVEIASVGVPLAGFELRIVDRRRRPLAPECIGRVEVRGPSLMDGYLGQPELTAESLRDGWLDTGDLGFLADGELYLTGRAKDMLLLRGRNHAPDEVETAVDGLPGVRRGCTVAVSWLPEGADGEVLLLFVEAARGVARDAWAGIAEACAAAIPHACGLATERVIVLEPGTLPRTSSGKLRRRETLRRWLAGELRPPRRMTLLRLAGAMVRSRVAFARGR